MKRVLVCLSLSAIACGSDGGTTATPPVSQPAGLVAASSPSSQLLIGQSVTDSVRVFAANGNPLKDVAVSFAASNGGTVSSSQPPTNVDGIASVQWTMAKFVGQQSLTATIQGTFFKVQFLSAVSVSLAGGWAGAANGSTYDLVVINDPQSPFRFTMQGNEFRAGGTRFPVIVTGSINGAAFATGGTMTYNGTVDSTGNSMTGTINGGSFTLVLTRK